MDMTRKKQYENQVTDLTLGHTPVISLNPIIVLQYVIIIITNVVQQMYSYCVLYSAGRGGLSTLADGQCRTPQVAQVALESLQEMRPVLV